MKKTLLAGCALSLLVACGDDDFDEPAPASAPVNALFAENAGAASATFFDAPYPSDLRLTARGTPDVANWPVDAKKAAMLATTFRAAGERPGFPVVPVGYFRFDADPPARDATTVESRGYGGAFALVDVDPSSPERGRTFPVVGTNPTVDRYTPAHLFAVAARPGVLLHPKRRYAFVLFTRLGDEAQVELVPSAEITALAKGETPARGDGGALAQLYAPLWETLDQQKVERGTVLAATVFTTGDAVEQTAQITDAVAKAHAVTLEQLALEPDPAGQFTSFCHYTAKVTMPQFQVGTPIFNSDGLFQNDANGVPMKQRDDVVSFSLTIPKAPMPTAGYPLVIYFHGSGGVAREFVDGAEKNEPGQLQTWPAFVLSPRGFAVAGTSLPISPDRVPRAAAYDYLNLGNPGAMLGTFRQGIIEQRLLLDALAAVRLPKSLLDQCAGASLPTGVTEAKLDLTRLAAQGQSMGGMYTNLISATEPRIQLAVPTGAGGYWMYFILQTHTVGGAALLQVLLNTPSPSFTFMSPILDLMETALEPIDPMVSMPRLARYPLAGHPVRPIYEPVGLDDSYFPTTVYDAMVLAYGHPRAGDEIWPSMHEAQSSMGLGDVATFPVKQNLVSETGVPYTGVVVQYKTDPGIDSHGIFRRLEAVRHQYGCFHSTFLKNGVAVVAPPGKETDPCPE